jgi:hypothetical protein
MFRCLHLQTGGYKPNASSTWGASPSAFVASGFYAFASARALSPQGRQMRSVALFIYACAIT